MFEFPAVACCLLIKHILTLKRETAGLNVRLLRKPCEVFFVTSVVQLKEYRIIAERIRYTNYY